MCVDDVVVNSYQALVTVRGLHSSTSQLSLRRF